MWQGAGGGPRRCCPQHRRQCRGCLGVVCHGGQLQRGRELPGRFTPARAAGRRSLPTRPGQGPDEDKSASRLSTRGAAVSVWSRPPSEPRKVSHYEVIWVREAVTVCVPAAVAARPLRQRRSEAEDGPRRDRAPAPTGQRRGPADSVPIAAPAPGRLAGRLGPVSPGNRANGSAALKTETPGHAFWPGVSSFAQLMLSAVSSMTKDVSLSEVCFPVNFSVTVCPA
jgi:hypothetical protein